MTRTQVLSVKTKSRELYEKQLNCVTIELGMLINAHSRVAPFNNGLP